MRPNKKEVTPEQLQMIVDKLEKDPFVIRDLGLPENRTIYGIDWDLLVNKLNRVPNGAKRHVGRWKMFLSDWIQEVKSHQNDPPCDENMEPKPLSETSQRLLRVVEGEEQVMQRTVDQDVDDEVDSDMDVENDENVFRRPTSRRSRHARIAAVLAQQRRQKTLKTIIGNNTQCDQKQDEQEKRIMQLQLERLYQVSEQLESQIKSVQNRIQQVKDMWAHDCLHD